MKNVFFVTATLLWFGFVNGQIEVSASLDRAINKAVEKSSALKNKALEIEKLNLQRKGILNKYIPTLEANAVYTYFDNKVTLDLPQQMIPVLNIPIFKDETVFKNNGSFFTGGIMAKSLLFSGLQVVNSAKAIDQKSKGTKLLSDSEKDGVIKEVITTFDQLGLLKEIEGLIMESEKRLTVENLRVTKAIEQGLTIPYDRDKIKLAMLELNAKKIELNGKRKLLYMKIAYLTGYAVPDIEAIIHIVKPFYITTENLTTQNKQEIQALQLFKTAQEYLIKKEKGTFLPTLGAFAGLNYSSLFDVKSNTTSPITHKNTTLKVNEITISPNWMVGAALKWEIFSGFERSHKIHEAKLNMQQTQNQIQDTKEKLQLLLENNLVNYTMANQKIDIVAQQEKIAQNNNTMAIKQYKEGLINISERLQAENDWYKIGVTKISTIIEQRLSAMETIITTGELSKYTVK